MNRNIDFAPGCRGVSSKISKKLILKNESWRKSSVRAWKCHIVLLPSTTFPMRLKSLKDHLNYF